MLWGHLSNKEEVLRCSVCNRDEGEKSISPFCKPYPQRGGEVGAFRARYLESSYILKEFRG